MQCIAIHYSDVTESDNQTCVDLSLTVQVDMPVT